MFPMELPRRSFLAAATATLAHAAQAQRDWSGRQPIRYPDPDVVSLDPRFDKYRINNAAIQKLYTGARWAEGPTWSAAGRYLVFSDIPNNRQMRWIEDDGHVSVFHDPSGYSNGNTFDFEGRQLSCQHAGRRVVRYEHDGSVTTIADKWQGKPLNSPNDIVVHPDGGIWFTDPTYGIQGNYEGFQATPEIKPAVYRVDPKTGAMEMVSDQFGQPNGLCFSPDYKKLYIADTARRQGHSRFRRGGRQEPEPRAAVFQHGTPQRAPAWPTAYAPMWTAIFGRAPDGWDPATMACMCSRPTGERIGMILLPEVCANVCFGGPKRNRLFMAASQSIYALYVGTRGAHIA